MKKILASLAIVAMAAVPFGALADDEADATIPLTQADSSLPTLYLDVETNGVWEETNGDPGLQTTEQVIGEGDDMIVIPPDTRVA